MKYKTTKKEINACYYAVSIGYCDLQDLLSYENAAAYTCGVYGWNADIYTFGNVAIVTGYRPFGIHVDYDIVHKYNKKARAIREDYTKDYETQKKELFAMIRAFIKETTGKEIAVWSRRDPRGLLRRYNSAGNDSKPRRINRKTTAKQNSSLKQNVNGRTAQNG